MFRRILLSLLHLGRSRVPSKPPSYGAACRGPVWDSVPGGWQPSSRTCQARARRAADGCEFLWIPLDNKVFSGSTVPERLSLVVSAAIAIGLDRLQGSKPDGFVAWNARCLKKSFFPARQEKPHSVANRHA